MARVLLKNVSKTYAGSGRAAVVDCSFEVKDREFVVLVGPSGCGKSTTLRMIAGLEEAGGGEIHIGDRVVNHVPPKDRDIAMVFQNYALYPHMTVYKNMAFGLILRKFPKPEIDKRVREAAEMLGLTEYLDRRPKALSGGQRQRVAVGRAIVRKPQVFLFDEPLSNLDAKMRVQMRAEIGRLRHRLEATVVYVTHDQVEAMTMGDRIVVMNEGLVQQIDEPMAIYDRPANKFVAGFIGSPAMNFFEGELVEENAGMVFKSGAWTLKVAAEQRETLRKAGGKGVTLGLRPEFFRLAGGSQREAEELQPVAATVEVVEPMGAESFAHCRAGETAFVARLEGQARGEYGQAIELEVDLSKARWFDAGNGLAL